MSGPAPRTCLACGSTNTHRHCEAPNASKTCNWWKCRQCKAYGDVARWTRNPADNKDKKP